MSGPEFFDLSEEQKAEMDRLIGALYDFCNAENIPILLYAVTEINLEGMHVRTTFNMPHDRSPIHFYTMARIAAGDVPDELLAAIAGMKKGGITAIPLSPSNLAAAARESKKHKPGEHCTACEEAGFCPMYQAWKEGQQ